MTPCRAATYAINTLLVLAIAGILTVTWFPAIYTSAWFQHNAWVRTHLLGGGGPPADGK